MILLIRVLLLGLVLAGCEGPPAPPQPTGKQIPVNADLWDYHGNETFPAHEDAP